MSILLLESLPENLRSLILTRDLQPGEVLFRHGDPVEAVYVVQSGRLRVVHHIGSDHSVVVLVARTGESLGELALFAETFTCEASAEVPSRVLLYPKHALREALRLHPDLAEDFMRLQARQAMQLRSRLALRAIPSARERILEFLQANLPPGSRTVTLDRLLKDIADDIGLSPEAFYRTLAALQKQGDIVRHGRSIELTNRIAS